MPNWCENTLILRGKPSRLKEFEKLAKTKESDLTFDKIYPKPRDPDVQARQAKKSGSFIVALTSRGSKKQPLAQRRRGAWYEWCISHWGTKWEAQSVSKRFLTDNELVYNFDTAWSPPDGVIHKIHERFPDLDIRLQYMELGCYFAGVIEYEDGELVNEESGDPENFDFSRQVLEEMKDDDDNDEEAGANV